VANGDKLVWAPAKSAEEFTLDLVHLFAQSLA